MASESGPSYADMAKRTTAPLSCSSSSARATSRAVAVPAASQGRVCPMCVGRPSLIECRHYSRDLPTYGGASGPTTPATPVSSPTAGLPLPKLSLRPGAEPEQPESGPLGGLPYLRNDAPNVRANTR